MNIIFGTNDIEQLREKYILLELDTISIKGNPATAAYCVADNIPFENLSRTGPYLKLHNELLENYRKRNWNYCEQAIEHLRGFWGADIDTFYDSLLERVKLYQTNEPDENWTGIVEKN